MAHILRLPNIGTKADPREGNVMRIYLENFGLVLWPALSLLISSGAMVVMVLAAARRGEIPGR